MTAYWQNTRSWHDHASLLEVVHNVVARAQNMYIRPSDGRVGVKEGQQPLDAPWIFAVQDPCRHCALWNHIYFQQFGLIPSKCRFACWKVVVKPHTIVDLFTFLNMIKIMRVNGKAGIDVREYTPDPYAGFLYNDSLSQGRKMLDKIRDHIEAEEWLQQPSSFLKRGCTEMEWAKPADQWDQVTDQELELENALDEIFVKEEGQANSPQWLEENRKKQWVRHAIMIGDQTWRDLVDDPQDWLPWTVKFDTDAMFLETKSPNGSDGALKNL